MGEARHSPGLRRGNLANLFRSSQSAGGSSGSALSRARKEGDARNDLREAMGIRAGTEQSLRRIRISAGAQAPEEAEAASEPVGHRWMDSGGLLKG